MDNTALEGFSGYVNTALGFPRALFISLHPPVLYLSLYTPSCYIYLSTPPRSVFSIHTFGSAFGTACNIWCGILANNNYKHQVCVLLNILQLNQVCASRRP